MKGTCDVCEKTSEVWVGSLPFAPMSVAFCAECLKESAYPLWALHATVECLGGYDQAAEWFKELRSYHDGMYIDGPQVKMLYMPTPSDFAHP